MIEYKCDECGVEGVKLWREYQTFLDHQTLRCVDCAQKNQEVVEDYFEAMNKGEKHLDQIGWLVPAVPTVEMDTYWGYTTVPEDRVEWWWALPLRK
jgi:hypothetical protein